MGSAHTAQSMPPAQAAGERRDPRYVLSPAECTSYLGRLGIGPPGQPSIAALRALHRAHVERVPSETLDINLGRLTTVDPRDSVARILDGRGGYCVQLNGAFSVLLESLGYQVAWHRAGVQIGSSPRVSGDWVPPLALTVILAGRTWLVDVGLGDGLHEPLPLRAGTYRQGPFGYRLGPSRIEAAGWRFDGDPRGSVVGLDIRLAPADVSDFAAWHPYVATSPDSRLVRVAAVIRRDANHLHRLTGSELSHINRHRQSQCELHTP